MKELAAILQACAHAPGRRMALATLARASGSTYRRPGARMLIFPDGQSVGAISGGCLERDVIEKAQAVLEGGQSVVLTYDTTPEEDVVFGAGLGCKGVVDILVEPVGPGLPGAELVRFINTIFKGRQSGVAATIFRIRGGVAARPGDRLMLDSTGNCLGQIQDPALQTQMLALAREALAANRSKTVELELANGGVEVFVELIHAPRPLVIFGAGHDAGPIVRLAKEVGFEVTVVDARPAYARPERFPEADAVVAARPEDLSKIGLNPRTAAVVMSHNYLMDRAFLQALLPRSLAYLALLGPGARVRQMLQELRQEGWEADEAASLRQIHCPAGLDIGAENPEQIALAVLAEIQAVISGHAGGFLREKKGPIHAPSGGGSSQNQSQRP
ncbi:MAG: XdhC family protein [Verrucomicrobiota bacterium]|jgi:xanthine/CO dehydrogenase XdhC/CoxF family maturation factor